MGLVFPIGGEGTEVLAQVDGRRVVLEVRLETPSHEDNFKPYYYWFEPCSETLIECDDVIHWQELPTKEDDSKAGIRYRVMFVPAITDECCYVSDTVTLSEAGMIESAIANYTLLLHSSNLMYDYSNSSIIQEFDGYEWLDYDE
jgi:hypothetical protein